MKYHKQHIRLLRGAALALLLALTGALATVGAASAQEPGAAKVPVESFTLDNGMRFLVVERPELTTIYGGWVAHVGSSNERPGITGISHFFEHMMFKGTRTIGTQDIEKDLAIIAEQERVQAEIRALYREQRERWRLGEIEDPFADDARTEELVALEQEFQELVEQQRALMIKDELDKTYTENGAAGLNAFTNYDITGYFINVPANKAELWFWLESDRLSYPVFREFYSERDVVYEERRLRTESTPTGKYDEQFDAMFWQSHPYSWPVVGWPSDLESYTQAQADEYFATYYAPNNLTAVLVGPLSAADAKPLAERYFGRIPRGAKEPPDVVTMEMEQKAEKRMSAECDCPPQLEVRYHTVPFRHKDSYALDVLANLLNGQTGRLYKALVLGDEIASSAQANQESRKWAGAFSFFAETKGDATPEQVEQGWYKALQRIIDEPIPEEELRKVKNNIAADAYRRLENPFFLLIQLILYDGLGDWEYLNYWSEKTLAVTAEDVKRVAQEYFTPENRAVAQYTRKAGTEAEEIPPALADMPAAQRQQIMTQLKALRASTDVAELESGLTRLEATKTQVPPPMVPVLQLFETAIRERLDELRATEGGSEGGDS